MESVRDNDELESLTLLTNKTLIKNVTALSGTVTPRCVSRDKKRASAGPKEQFLGALKDDFCRQFHQNQSVIN